MTMKFNEETRNWDVVFPDSTTRSFDGRFTEDQAWLKASRYWNGDDRWVDGLYTAA